jgi:hypothetical protein
VGRPERDGELHFGERETLLQRQRQLVEPGTLRRHGHVPAGPGVQVPHIPGGGEESALDHDISHVGESVADDEAGGQGSGDSGDWLQAAAVDPDPGVDPPHAVEEQHGLRQHDPWIGGQRLPLLGRHLEVQVQLGRRLGESPGRGHILGDRLAVAGIPGIDGKRERRSRRSGQGLGHATVSFRSVDVVPARDTTNRTGARSASAGT